MKAGVIFIEIYYHWAMYFNFSETPKYQGQNNTFYLYNNAICSIVNRINVPKIYYLFKNWPWVCSLIFNNYLIHIYFSLNWHPAVNIVSMYNIEVLILTYHRQLIENNSFWLLCLPKDATRKITINFSPDLLMLFHWIWIVYWSKAKYIVLSFCMQCIMIVMFTTWICS